MCLKHCIATILVLFDHLPYGTVTLHLANVRTIRNITHTHTWHEVKSDIQKGTI